MAKEKTTRREDQVVLRLVDANGRPVAGAKAAGPDAVRVLEVPVLGSRLEWSPATGVSDDSGRVALKVKDLFPGQLNESAVYILHEGRSIGAIHQVLRGKLGEESPVVLGPVCRVHGTLGSTALAALGMPLQWTEIEVLHAHLFTLLRCSFNPQKYDFEFLLPPGEHVLWNYCGWGGKGDELRGIVAGTEYNKRIPITVPAGQSDLDVGVIDLRPTRLSTMTGRPAPEIGPMQAWKNGPAATLASLRGQTVWLHFGGGNPDVSRSLPVLAEIHKTVAAKGLTIIAIFNCASMEELDRKWSDASRLFRGAQEVPFRGVPELPFRVAIDGGEPTFYEGSTVERRGATYGRYEILGPTNVLIDPAGNLVGQINDPQLARETVSRLLVLRPEPLPPAWRQRFHEVYHLADGEILKRIAPPFIPERDDYYRNEEPQLAERWRATPDRFIFESDGKLKTWGYAWTPLTLDNALQVVLGFKNFEYEGPGPLLESPLPGDWIIRSEAPLEVKLRALEELVAHELGRHIRFDKRLVERKVLVATGRFQFHPVAAARENALVHLYTKDTDLEERGIGREMADSLSQFLQRLGDHANLPVIDQTEPGRLTRIPYQRHSSSYAVRRGQDEQERTKQLRVLLDHLTTQTQLQFENRQEPVPIWFVTE